jgi:hypothetical protein
MGAAIGRDHGAHAQPQPLDHVLISPFFHEIVAGSVLFHEIITPVPAGCKGQWLPGRGLGHAGDDFAAPAPGKPVQKIRKTLLSEADYDIIDPGAVEAGGIQRRVNSPDNDQRIPPLFDFPGQTDHRIGFAGDRGESDNLGFKAIVLRPKIRLVLALQIHDDDLMGAQGSGEHLEAEGFSAKDLPNGCDAVFLLGDAAAGIGRIDEHDLHETCPREIFMLPCSGNQPGRFSIKTFRSASFFYELTLTQTALCDQLTLCTHLISRGSADHCRRGIRPRGVWRERQGKGLSTARRREPVPLRGGGLKGCCPRQGMQRVIPDSGRIKNGESGSLPDSPSST